MKRRKNPIILITVLVLCAGLVFIMSSAQTKPGSPTPQAPTESAPATGQKGPNVSKDEIVANVQSDVKSGAPGPANIPEMKRRRMAGGRGGPPDSPSILDTKPPAYVPQPSDTSPSAGWYTDQAPPSYVPPKKK